MSYNEVYKQTRNISNTSIVPLGIVLHHTAGSYQGSVNWCLNPESKVSYHVIVDTNGNRTILAKDNQRAWHSGKSSFKGKSDCNSFMIGIAVSGDTTSRQLTQHEVISVAKLCISKMKIHGFGINEITTHREVAPGRKIDISKSAYDTIIHEIKTLLSLVSN